jgi:hypothetical protein
VIPAPWTFALLALAAYRLWRLIGIDEITAPIRDRVTGRLWASGEDTRWERYHPTLDKLIGCPWCLGAWVSLAATLAWWIWPHATLIACVPFAVSAVVGLVTKNLDA